MQIKFLLLFFWARYCNGSLFKFYDVSYWKQMKHVILQHVGNSLKYLPGLVGGELWKLKGIMRAKVSDIRQQDMADNISTKVRFFHSKLISR